MKKFDGYKKHEVAIEGFILGDFYKVGDTVDLNWLQAKEFVREKRVLPPGAQKAKTSASGKSKD